ncbi:MULTISPECIES: M24 family metallopeptidase [Rhizobium/Agrobacterium group]|uniref:Xaa-Pro aminopeptidase n=2 Tax=Agrobacterium tumefaciens TaxID=358 RepID=A0A2Z2PFU4_AGRTU|nr:MULTISPECIES: Xaa-Pro peptidase family protein [Rhizobium/Agrobacterium group]AHK05164.1 agropine synthase, lactonization [Agrobacterium tumefaciens LBA4213 (Ach5)]AKC10893.1 hypothetical protein Ach5_51300 [Agrobacterium tumefaciens]ASK41683.1 hypothetical protein [Agrobacterium tumefaciens]ASK47188.1 peptidase M24 family protein [Agrobacterium radiobacter]AVH45208.1 hypothetical protein At1D1609_51740 [Agrobacterium tumefaciens]
MDLSKLNSPSQEQYHHRVRRAQNAMMQSGVDVIVLSGPDFHNYFTGLWGLPVGRAVWLVMHQSGKPIFVAPRSEALEIKARCEIEVAAEWFEWERKIAGPMTHQDALSACISLTTGSIGLDYNYTSGSNLELIKRTFGAERVRDVTLLLQDLWACKDAEGIAAIKQSCDIVGHQFMECRQVISPGTCEWRVTLASVQTAIERNSQLLGENEELPRFWPHQLNMVGSGANRTARCHTSGGGRIMQDGEHVQVCLCGQLFRGHAVCFDRPLPVGSKPLSGDILKVIKTARDAQLAALSAIRPGVMAREVHAAAVAVVNRGGWTDPFLHRTGRGIGYSDWDGIELKAGAETMLKVGNVLSVEPGIYVEGIGGARFGDTVLVTETGYEALTPLDLGKDI